MTRSVDLAEVAAQWRPQPEEKYELIETSPSRALAGLLDQPADDLVIGARVPPMWTSLHFLDRPAQHELGPDGHPRDGAFLPPIPGRRRMFAGGRLQVFSPLMFGERATRVSEVSSVTPKSGRTGPLLFVTVRHTYAVDGEVRVIEHQDLVYRSSDQLAGTRDDLSAPADPPPEKVDPQRPVPDAPAGRPVDRWSLTFRPDPVMLFRFSALTYNAHRIHYDLPYATAAEGLPGLLVHGPLLVILALELPRRHAPSRLIERIDYRARRPVTAGEAVVAAAPTSEAASRQTLEVRTSTAGAAMTADIDWEQRP